MSKHVLILGAGLVSQPIIDYLFEKTECVLTVADIREENAAKAIKANPRGRSAVLDVADEVRLGALVADADLVVSLLPYTLHGVVARHCLSTKKHMVNASYVSDEMRGFDAEAREKGLLFLCEIGLDPGIDHMSAMQIINDVKSRGGQVTEFVSVCGGLPAPDANNNPFGYKFSWSPKGVLLAGNNSARYIDGGQIRTIPAEDLFHSTKPMVIDGQEFESYPNRDSVSYEEVYGLQGIQFLMRGTLRYAGWHQLILAIRALRLTEELPVAAGRHSYAEILAMASGCRSTDIRRAVNEKLGAATPASVIDALDWLGLFDETGQDFKDTTVIDVLADLMNRKMAYASGERDMVVLQHQFTAEFPQGREKITSTLIDYGIPNGASSMARTVSLPLAIAVRLILEDKVTLRGVQIPVHAELYEPVLEELESLGIVFNEKTEKL